MLTTVLVLALGGWTEVKANGFGFQMPGKPTLESGPITWPTTGQMVQSKWTSKLDSGDKQLDEVACYESTVESPRMVGLLHEKLCKDAKGQQKFDRVDPTTQARECLRINQEPDGKRRILTKILQVGSHVCALTSSAKIDKDTGEPSPGMRRFIDSLKVTGKPTILAATTPWVAMKGNGFTFQMPQPAEPAIKDEEEPELGKYKATRWRAQLGEERLLVACMVGPKVTTPAGVTALLAQFSGQPGSKAVQTKLPNGATELSISGSTIGLVRVFPLKGQTCVIGAMRETGDPTQDARRFVESFAKAK